MKKKLDVGEMTGGKSFGLSVSDDPLEVFSKIQAFIDFTTPSASTRYAHFAAQARCVHVIGTTGFSEKHFQKLSAAARHAVLIRAGNMSLGVNLLSQLAEKVAKALDEDFDVEILETHHRMKVDAPSGTALMLGEAVLIKSYDFAAVSIVQPFAYFHLVFISLVGILIFDERLSLNILVGSLIVICFTPAHVLSLI